MGIKIIATICFSIIYFNLYSQNDIKLDAKSYGFCKCIQDENKKIDTTQNNFVLNDYSLSYFTQNTKLSINKMYLIDKYYKNHIKDFIIFPSEFNQTNSKFNMISLYCWKFANSHNFEKFIKFYIVK